MPDMHPALTEYERRFEKARNTQQGPDHTAICDAVARDFDLTFEELDAMVIEATTQFIGVG